MSQAVVDRVRGDEAPCHAAADYVRRRWPRRPRAGIILGTGSGDLVQQLVQEVVLPFSEIPHFSCSTALGHRGQLVLGLLDRIPVMVLNGRCHFYEGYSCDEVTLPVSVLQNLGGELLVVTNASGGLNPRFRSGEIMVLADHINLMGRHTASLCQRPALPSRSGQVTPYDPRLIELTQEVARAHGFGCPCGTYVGVLGPNYETRAEYRLMRRLGGDAVGMSTIPEVLAAMQCGLPVWALSTITNIARPDALAPTVGQEVVDIAATAEPRLRKLVLGVLGRYFAEDE